jgi:hypothetical protein
VCRSRRCLRTWKSQLLLKYGNYAKISCSPATASTCARVHADDFKLRLLVTGFKYKLPTQNGDYNDECVPPRPLLLDGECCYLGGGTSGSLYWKVVAMGFQKHYAQPHTAGYTQSLSLVTQSADEVPIGVQCSSRQQRSITSLSLVCVLKRASVLWSSSVDLAPGSTRLPRIIITLQLLGLHLEWTQLNPRSPPSKFLVLTFFVRHPASRSRGPLPVLATKWVLVVLLVKGGRGEQRRRAGSRNITF